MTPQIISFLLVVGISAICATIISVVAILNLKI